jgi:hypothetical protein
MLKGRVKTALSLLLLSACSGSVSYNDGGIVEPRRDGAATDQQIVEQGSTEQGANDLSAADLGETDASSSDGTPLHPCLVWENWSCAAEEVLLCSATCGAITPTTTISCTNGGTCLCGISRGVGCGPFSGNTPCEVCKKAVLSGCCIF